MASKSALVTGGGQGIGKAITEVLLKQGYKVGILDVNETVGKETAEEFSSQFGSGSCVFYKCDVTKTEDLKGCYDNVSQCLGQPTVVVNNAGIADELNWGKMIDINVKAVMDMTYIAVDKMRKDQGGNGGTIVNMASVAGTVSHPGLVGYIASKWAVVGFTQSMVASLALAEKDWGISMLTLCPGIVSTSLTTPWNSAENIPSPAASPREECQQFIHRLATPDAIMSLDELSLAFEKLLNDNKNGAVMRVQKQENKLEIAYIEQKWTEVEDHTV